VHHTASSVFKFVTQAARWQHCSPSQQSRGQRASQGVVLHSIGRPTSDRWFASRLWLLSPLTPGIIDFSRPRPVQISELRAQSALQLRGFFSSSKTDPLLSMADCKATPDLHGMTTGVQGHPSLMLPWCVWSKGAFLRGTGPVSPSDDKIKPHRHGKTETVTEKRHMQPEGKSAIVPRLG
jgi:hypothetical protein